MGRIISLFSIGGMRRQWVILSLVCLGVFCLPRTGYAGGERVELTGEYQYTYGDQQTPEQARQIVYAMAVRKAIEAYPAFMEDTSPVKDPDVIKSLVQTLASGHLQDLEIVEQTEQGRRLSCKVRASVDPVEFKTVLNREMNRLLDKQPDVVTENRYIKILNVTDYSVEDTRRKRTVREIKVVYQQVSSDPTQILIDFYDTKGKPLMGKRSTTQEFLLPGEIRQVVFTMPDDAKSYRVWLKK
ncbi:MAG: hypothetical protein ACREJU_10240 [Nitrospiraceae bacterium]